MHARQTLLPVQHAASNIRQQTVILLRFHSSRLNNIFLAMKNWYARQTVILLCSKKNNILAMNMNTCMLHTSRFIVKMSFFWMEGVLY